MLDACEEEVKMKKMIKMCIEALLMLSTIQVYSLPNNIKKIIADNKENLGMYEYCSYAIKDVVLESEKTQKEVIEFSVFAGGFYKIIFCAANIDSDVSYVVYDKPANSKSRKVIIASEPGSKICSFEASRVGTYYIECSIPPANIKNKKSPKIVMVIGQKKKITKLPA